MTRRIALRDRIWNGSKETLNSRIGGMLSQNLLRIGAIRKKLAAEKEERSLQLIVYGVTYSFLVVPFDNFNF